MSTEETNTAADLSIETSRDEAASISSLQVINDQSLEDIKVPQEAADLDPDLSRYIFACQKGDLKTVKELIEAGTVNARSLDGDGVSGLHWAAINNRLATAKYLVQQGAEVDLKGGELHATALQWACRYGHVYIADYLIRTAKADPTIYDTQGFNILHLAVHSSNIMLVIYLLYFTDLPVDSLDPSKRTSLHWAAYQGDSLSVDALLKHGAAPSARDVTQFTPLHWSLMRGVPAVMKSLIAHGASVLDKNNDDKDGFTIAAEMNCLPRLADAIRESGLDPKGLPLKPLMAPKTAKLVTFFQPYVMIGLILHILSLSQNWIVPKLALSVLLIVVNQLLLMRVVLPCYVHSHNPLLKTPYLAGMFSASAFWVLVTWITKLLAVTFEDHWLLNILFPIAAAVTVASFFKSMFINPGYIPTPAKKETVRDTILQLIESWSYDSKHFCIYSFVRKPLRSKYSWTSKAIVARFDHYCPWVYNEIGVRNHKLFATFVYSLLVTILIYLRMAWSFFDEQDGDDDSTCSFLSETLCQGFQEQSFVFNLTVWTSFQLMWLSFLVFVQTFQICKGITSWEATTIHTVGVDPNGNEMNPYYSSVPSEVLDADSESDVLDASSGAATVGQQAAQRSATAHSHSHDAGCFRKLFTGSSISKLLGLDLFVLTARDAVSSRQKSSVMYTNYGLKMNVLDFWFLKNDELGEGYDLKTLLRLPIAGEANLNGKLVDYYKLYQLPPRDSMV